MAIEGVSTECLLFWAAPRLTAVLVCFHLHSHRKGTQCKRENSSLQEMKTIQKCSHVKYALASSGTSVPATSEEERKKQTKNKQTNKGGSAARQVKSSFFLR